MLCNKISNGVFVWIQKHPKCATVSFMATISVIIGLIFGLTAGISIGFIGAGCSSSVLAFILIATVVTCKNKKKKLESKPKGHDDKKPSAVSNKDDGRTTTPTISKNPSTGDPDALPLKWKDWSLRLDPKMGQHSYYNEKTKEIFFVPPYGSPWANVDTWARTSAVIANTATVMTLASQCYFLTWNNWIISFDEEHGRFHWQNKCEGKPAQDIWAPPLNSPWCSMKDEDGSPFHWNDWSRIFDPVNRNFYYFNHKDETRVCDPPSGSPWTPLPKGRIKVSASHTLLASLSQSFLLRWNNWIKHYDAGHNRVYYFDQVTGESAWVPPPESPWNQ